MAKTSELALALDLETVDRALLSACDLAEAAPLIETRGRLISDLLRHASEAPSVELSSRLKAALERGEHISFRLARLRGEVSGNLRRIRQFSQML